MHFHQYIIGARNLVVEVDAKYIHGMLNKSEKQPSAVISHWIQGILIYDFELVHVPATKFKGIDALSRQPVDQSQVPDYDDSWLDNRAFYGHQQSDTPIPPDQPTATCLMNAMPCYNTKAVKQETTLSDIYAHLINPEPSTVIHDFFKKVDRYYVKAGQMFRRTNNGLPLLVILHTDT